MESIINIIMLGVLATVIIDVWATFSNKVLGLPRTNWAMVGRWLGHIPGGQFVHNPVSASAPIPYENIVGWAFHYLIGIVYALCYVALVVFFLEGQPTLLSAWVFGVATILSPWLIMQPCLGLGLCATKAPEPNRVRVQNFAIHSIFGVALYYGWLWIANV